MSIGKRLSGIVRSWRFRGESPEELKDKLDATYREQAALLQQVRRSVADVATSRKRIELQLATLRRQSAQLDDRARQAVGRGDDDEARAVLTRKVTLDKAATDLEERHADLRAEELHLQDSAQAMERKVEDFRSRKDTLAARHTAAAARAEMNSATKGITSSASEVGQAMASAERRTRELEATASAVDELVADGVITAPGESDETAFERRFDAALDDAEIDRRLEALTGSQEEGDHGTDPIQK